MALAQFSITAGLKKFNEKGKKGVTKELTQMHDMRVFTPVLKESLNKEERSKALASLMFLKEKRDKTVKACMCADGRKATRGLDEARIDIAHCCHRVGVHHSGGGRPRRTGCRILRHPWSVPTCRFR